MTFIIQLAVVIVATKIAGHASVRWLGQPAVLGELIVGILVGPALLGWIPDSEMMHVFSEIGVLMLMFIAGLETNLEDLRNSARSSSAVALGGVILPLGFGYLAGTLLGMDTSHAIFLGLILSATSVSISVQTLKELGKLQSKESMTLLGAAVLDDVLVIVLLAFAMSIFGDSDTSIWWIVGEKIFFFASAILVAWKGVPWLLRLFGRLKVSEPAISLAIVLCFIFAWYADLLGVAGIIGSFIAGTALAQTSFKATIERKIEPVAYGIFVPVFFVSIGLKVTFNGIFDQVWFIIGITLIAVLTKFIGSGFGAWMTGFSPLSSFRIGSGMVSRGEVALILASIGIEAHLLAQKYFTPLILVVILTTLITPPLLKILFEKEKAPARANK
ncbi:cation:proton antiporter [Sporolactobacillus shoreicorticis]|uniref:Cation:proton antiporter n=1 Tax=Sporolactobacillus shoreicorticis TaxID=1923877 RepID=A0ABW5S133_9BACL|nr:cation:proton antiporter [Sporolactobacillus shoreicorticis]MCO7128040.1 cation:proton antiporter [Sporolactobacillus shoreicorticis]